MNIVPNERDRVRLPQTATVLNGYGKTNLCASWETRPMALRNPVYLDLESLLAQAEYNEIDVPVQADIVEKTVHQRSGNAKVGYGPLAAGGCSWAWSSPTRLC